MASYALINWTTKKTHGSFRTVEDARDATAKYVGADHEWSIIELPAQVGPGHEIATGRGPVSG